MDLLVPEATAGRRLDVFLAAAVPGVSRVQLQRLIRSGGVSIAGEICRVPKTPLASGMIISVVLPEANDHEQEPVAESLPLTVLYEDKQLLVVDKPAGMVVHPAAGIRSGTLVNALLARYPGFARRFPDSPLRPGIVHRLDKDTSGCLAVALDKPSQLFLVKAFANREVRKTYLALVLGRPRSEAGEISAAIGRHPVQRQKMAMLERGGRAAVTRYRLVRCGKIEDLPVSLLEVAILTGRTHQIRVHLAGMRMPVLGDATYGGSRSLVAPRQMLHAWKLGLPHPATGEFREWESPLPGDFRGWLARLA